MTCVSNFDLKEALPVMSVGLGGGVSQASVDSDASRRAIMKDGFENGDSLDDIFAELATRPSHASRQYGMVNVMDEALTVTGTATSVWGRVPVRVIVPVVRAHWVAPDHSGDAGDADGAGDAPSTTCRSRPRTMPGASQVALAT